MQKKDTQAKQVFKLERKLRLSATQRVKTKNKLPQKNKHLLKIKSSSESQILQLENWAKCKFKLSTLIK